MMDCDDIATGDFHKSHSLLCLSVIFFNAFRVVLQISCEMGTVSLSSHHGGTYCILHFMSPAL